MTFSDVELIELTCASLLALVVPSWVYSEARAKARSAWPLAAHGPHGATDVGPYRRRAASHDTIEAGGPPRVVRVAAFASYVLGQMSVLWLLFCLSVVALYLFLFWVYGSEFFVTGSFVTLIICLCVAPWVGFGRQIFALGTKLLCAAPGAAEQATKAADKAYLLSGLVFFAGACAHSKAWPEGAGLVAYATVCVGYGVLMQRAAIAMRAALQGLPHEPPEISALPGVDPGRS